MTNRWFAFWFVLLAAALGWVTGWAYEYRRGIVLVAGYVAYVLLVLLLKERLDNGEEHHGQHR